ncbi:aldo/keto reductase [Ruminococcus gauvreauii]|uniref:Aldo/keto reductase n=1 Tax=Ruminococcus gauvreauii TaxID=438033 RepID=A0ABY5VDV5_9FIRM|nr:aldo/keto reductase [Ruminococcus gauvreauii]UWP58393.1 aldo/keto reductase [Ruminococcus gauvreauii]
MNSITLNNGNQIPQMMFGSFQMNEQADMDAVVKTAVDNGVLGFDTSPSYRTEEMLSAAVRGLIAKREGLSRSDFFLDTKIDEWQMIAKKGEIRPFVEKCLEKTNLDYWDLILIHWPQPDYYTKTWLAMEKLYEEGIVKNIGVCNFSVRHFKGLERAGANVVPAVMQNEVHPLNTENEVLEYCEENHITVQAYSPLCRMIPEIRENELLNHLAEKYGVSLAQIILRWHIERGLVPVVKTSSEKRVKENTDIFSFALSEEDRDAITGLDSHFKIFLESRCCPGY